MIKKQCMELSKINKINFKRFTITKRFDHNKSIRKKSRCHLTSQGNILWHHCGIMVWNYCVCFLNPINKVVAEIQAHGAEAEAGSSGG